MYIFKWYYPIVYCPLSHSLDKLVKDCGTFIVKESQVTERICRAALTKDFPSRQTVVSPSL